MKKLKNLAIIPMRGGSKRIPKKNIKPFFGKPIFLYTLEEAKKCKLFDEIMISTDSEEIAQLCRDHDGNIPFMRPPELATDEARLGDVCANVIQTYENKEVYFENFCILWATAPMRTAEDIKNAYQLLDEKTEAVVGVSEFDYPLFCAQYLAQSGELVPVFPDLCMAPAKEHPQAVVDNSSMCWVKTAAFKEQGTWLPKRLKGYSMPRSRSVDIDTQQQWDQAEFFFNKFLKERDRI
ncbi:MAG: acylneuraminate cytidylyltransferase family protein [Magnetococcales bacterium]|nr:acylneuraminate cytidylyltransferase family protein [Magnetococcales bacterium]